MGSITECNWGDRRTNSNSLRRRECRVPNIGSQGLNVLHRLLSRCLIIYGSRCLGLGRNVLPKSRLPIDLDLSDFNIVLPEDHELKESAARNGHS